MENNQNKELIKFLGESNLPQSKADQIAAIFEPMVAGLREFSDLLKALEPGQTVEATVRREGKELKVPVTVVER